MKWSLLGLLLAAVLSVLVYTHWSEQPDETDSAAEQTARPSSGIREPDPPPPARPQAAPLATAAQDTSTIDGVVLDTEGVPIGGAEILHRVLSITKQQQCFSLNDIQFELSDTTEFLQSDSKGRFTLPYDLHPTDEEHNHCLIVSAAHPGYLADTVAMPFDLTELPDMVEIELSPSRALEGIVVDPARQVVGRADVRAWRQDELSEDPNGNCVTEDEGSLHHVNSGADGRFKLDLPAQAGYCVQASHPAWASSEARWVQRTEIANEIRLELSSGYSFSGQVVDLEGRAVGGLSLGLDSDEQMDKAKMPRARTGGNGDFTFGGLDSGEYQITVADRGFHVADPETISVGPRQTAETVEVSVFPVSWISGRVLDDRGLGLGGVEVSSRSPYAQDESAASARTNASGYFELESLHRSNVAQENFKMASAFVGGGGSTFLGDVCLNFSHPQHTVESMALSVTAATRDIGEVRLSQPMMPIEGQVLNHRNEALAATLTFVSQSSDDQQPMESRLPGCEDVDFPRTVDTDEQGRFAVSLDRAEQYTVKVQTKKYKDRELTLNLNGERNIEIRLD